VDNNQISERRHTDPSLLWVTVFISSVSLHFLLFWSVRQYFEFGLWFSPPNQDAIPIELVDKSTHKVKSTTKQRNPVPNSVKGSHQEVKLKYPKTNKRTLLISTKGKTTNKRTLLISTKGKTINKGIPLISTKGKTTNKGTPLISTKGKTTNKGTPLISTKGKTTNKRIPLISTKGKTTNKRTPLISTKGKTTNEGTSGSQRGRGLIAVWEFLSPEEQRKHIIADPPPKDLILPSHRGSMEQKINLTDNSSQDLIKGTYTISLVIDNTGKYIGAEVEDSGAPAAAKQKLVDLAKQIFQDEPFEPAHYQNNNKQAPPESNLLVSITIQPSKF